MEVENLPRAARPPRGCAVCGLELAVEKRTGPPRTYCSTRCRRAREWALRKQDRRARGLKKRGGSPGCGVPMSGTCARCGGAFTYLGRRGAPRRYCSRRCGEKWRGRGRAPLVPVPLSRICACCGVRFEFVDFPGSCRRYCSARCTSTASYRAWRNRHGLACGSGPPAPLLTRCLCCQGPLPPRKAGGGRPRRYCSKRCRHGAERGIPTTPPRLLDVCLFCRSSIARTPGQRKPAESYCSSACRNATHRERVRLRKQIASVERDIAQARRAVQRDAPGASNLLVERLPSLGRLLDLCRARLDELTPGSDSNSVGVGAGR